MNNVFYYKDFYLKWSPYSSDKEFFIGEIYSSTSEEYLRTIFTVSERLEVVFHDHIDKFAPDGVYKYTPDCEG